MCRGVAAVVWRRHVAVRGVVERHVVGDGRLAGDAAQRQRVGAVGVDLELDDVVAQPQQRDRVVAGLHLAVDAWVEDQDPSVIVAGAELAGGADHPVGHVSVGLAGGDLEPSGKHRAGQRHDDQVAGLEVVSTADDAVLAVVGPAVDLAPVDGLAVLLRLGGHLQDPADDDRSLDVGARSLQRLELEPERGEPVRQVRGRHVVRQVDVRADPGQGGLHAGMSLSARPSRASLRGVAGQADERGDAEHRRATTPPPSRPRGGAQQAMAGSVIPRAPFRRRG